MSSQSYQPPHQAPMNQLTPLQNYLRNALVHARVAMKLTDENYFALVDTVTQISMKNWTQLGIGEDVMSMSDEVKLVDDALVVDETSPTPGTVVFAKADYACYVALMDVVLDGVNVSGKITKLYPNNSTKIWSMSQLPLKSNNFTLTVTILPGGSLKRAVLLMDSPQ